MKHIWDDKVNTVEFRKGVCDNKEIVYEALLRDYKMLKIDYEKLQEENEKLQEENEKLQEKVRKYESFAEGEITIFKNYE